jgi:hypothetical protein
LLLAEEQAQPPPAASQQPAEGSGPDGKGTPQDNSGTAQKGTTGWTGGSNEPPKGQSRAGSRALSPHAQDGAEDQPEMATGVDLKGPPMRFRASETPE